MISFFKLETQELVFLDGDCHNLDQLPTDLDKKCSRMGNGSHALLRSILYAYKLDDHLKTDDPDKNCLFAFHQITLSLK